VSGIILPEGMSAERLVLPAQWDNQTIDQVRKAMGLKDITDLVALHPNNDPFLAGLHHRRRQAEWFAEWFAMWQAAHRGRTAHLRRIHYWLVSLEEPVWMLPILKGKNAGQRRRYVNDKYSWGKLLRAGRDARYLGLVPLDLVDDHRTPDVYRYLPAKVVAPEVWVGGGLGQMPHLNWPAVYVTEYVAAQPVVVEIWSEKTTLDDILLPLCIRYAAPLQPGAGQMGLGALRALLERIKNDERPFVILYISDFDRQGEAMPGAVARKIEWYLRHHGVGSERVQLRPIALTKHQVEVDYPNLPLLISDNPDEALRKWQEKHKGRVEVDALEAIYPGAVGRLTEECICAYRDPLIKEQADAYNADLQEGKEQIEAQVGEEFAAEDAAFLEEVRALWERGNALSGRKAERLQTLLDERWPEEELPEPPEPPEPEGLPGEPLYDSQRDYLEQNRYYQERKRAGEESDEGAGDAGD
jgi:hypothetical protein